MNAVGRIGSYISRSVYTVSAPFHPFGGAVDIIVVEQQDGSFKSSPWYVRFGKFQGVLKAREKVVSISVNGVEADFNMFLDHKGEAYFLRDVGFVEVDGDSALYSPSSSSEDADEQSREREREREPGLKSKSCNYDAHESTSLTKIEVNNGKVLARTNSRRSRIMGIVFGKKPPAKIENEGEGEGEGESDSNVDRSESLERAEIAADLLEVKWSTNLASPRCKKESGSRACSQQSLESKDSVGTRLKHECSDDRIDGSDDSILRSGETEQVCDETAQTTGLVWEVNSEAETGFSGKGPLSVGDASDNQDSVHEKATVSPHSFGINIVSECSDDTTDSSDDIILCSGGTEQATGLACKVNSEAETGFSGKEPLSIEDASESRDASVSLCNRDAHEKATVSPHSSRNYFVSECSDGMTDGSDDIILCSGGTEQVYVETEQTTGLVYEVNSGSGTGFSGKKPFLSVGDASESQDASGFPYDKNAHENATVSPHSLGNNFVSECREDTTDGSDDIILRSGGTEQVYVETVQTTGLVCEVNSVAETGCSGKEPLSIEDASESQDASQENATASPHSSGNNFVDTTDGLNDIILHSGGTEQVYVETVQTTGLVCQVNCEAETGFTGKEPLSIGDASESQDALGFPCDKSAHENATISPRSLGNNFVSETTVTLQPVYGCVGGIESQSIMTISTVTSQALPEKTGPGEDEQTKYDPQMKSLGSPIHVLTSEISEEEHLLFGDFDDLKFTSVGDKEEPVSPKSDMKEGDPQLLNIELEEKFTGKLKSVSSQINIPATRDQSDADLRIARSLPIMSSNKLNNCNFGVNDSESLSTSHVTRNGKETNNPQSHSGQTAEDASTTTDPSIGNTTSNIGTDGEKDMLKSKVNNKKKTRSICPTTKQLASLNLKGGSNTIIFTFSTPMLGKQQVDARIYLWKWDTRVVISDVDGTITRSDLLGQVMPWVGVDWSHIGVTHLFSAIKENGYQMLFLSARAISQAYLTRQFLFNLKQDGKVLPEGPVVISPDGLFPSLYREVVRRAPHEFKIACLEEIKALFPADRNPFYAGFGNRDTDEISYLKVGIPKGKIFIINPKGEVVVNRRVDKKSYTSLHTLVHDMFPPTFSSEQEDFNCWNYWKLPNAYEL